MPAKCAATLSDARRIMASPDASSLIGVLLDLHLPDGDGFELLKELHANRPDAAVIVMTANGSINIAVQAMREGADDFLVKPFPQARLATTIQLARDRRRLIKLVRTVSPGLSDDRFEGFVGSDLSMQAVYRMVEQAARSKATVFITGESGTGKEVCAEAIHRRSDRRDNPFVAVNCAAIPRDLIESELFGHVKGAFTGATTDREGVATLAHRGTLFLDEICEMELPMQAKLLRFLQTGAVQRVGSDKTNAIDVRIVCATNRDPMVEVAAGRFREDLYYRLYVIPMNLPPLRERSGDVMKLAMHFLAEFVKEEDKAFSSYDAEAERLLVAYPWPGNIRELQNVIRNVVVLNDGEVVTAEMLPPRLRAAAVPAIRTEAPVQNGQGVGKPIARALTRENIRPIEAVEREHIEAAVAACGGNMTDAAHYLGISVKTIYRKRQAQAATAR
jgi:two-component system repressor protein LuxO